LLVDLSFDEFGFPDFKSYVSNSNHIVQPQGLTGKPSDFTKGKDALQSYLNTNGGGGGAVIDRGIQDLFDPPIF
jgi:hypothetical protein